MDSMVSEPKLASDPLPCMPLLYMAGCEFASALLCSGVSECEDNVFAQLDEHKGLLYR